MTLSEQLDLLVNEIPAISDKKRYWLIRTQSGALYETFIENKLVALEHDEVNLSFLQKCREDYKNEPEKRLGAIRQRVKAVHEKRLTKGEELNQHRVGLVASQISKFAFDIKKGDTIIIPDHNSDVVSFGIATESYLADLTPDQDKRLEINGILKRRVKWIKTVRRSSLDIFLYKVFSAHQAINDVTGYADIIERSLKDFFILNNEAHTVINVQTLKDISASDLFGLGSEILNLVDGLNAEYNLGISSKDLQVTINLNSPGKIDLKSKVKKTTLVTGLILFVCGGGYIAKDGTSIKTDGLPGVLKAISDFMDKQQERNMKQEVFDKYKDSLNVKTPTDMIDLWKQNSDNKDVPK